MLSPAQLRLASATAVLLSLMGHAAGQMPLTEANGAKAKQLVQDLGSTDFRTRERASAQLVRMGPAVESYLRQGMSSGEPEVRARCRQILPQALNYDRERRLQAFLDGKESKELPPPPGWARFKTLVGDDAKAREMFAAMFRADAEFLTTLEKKPAGVREQVEARCMELVYQNNTGTRMSLTPEQFGLLLFALLEPKLALDAQAQSNFVAVLLNLSGSPRSRRMVQNNTVVRRLLLKFVTDGGGRLVDESNGLMIIANFEMKEALDIARDFLKKSDHGPAARGMAILIIGRFGDKQVAGEILPLLNDKEALGETHFVNNIRITAQVRDVALAALIDLTGQSHDDYGFAFRRVFGGFTFNRIQSSPGLLGFSDEAARDTAFQRWASWYEKNKRTLQPK